MASMWLPGATVLKAASDAGSMLGGAKKVVWHTTENDPKKTSAANVARYLNKTGNCVHIVWNPETGEIVQTIPANRGSKGLKNATGGVQTNRGGTYVIQIEVVGKASEPFTNGPCKNLGKITSWLESLGIPDEFPAGAPKAYPGSYGGNRSTDAWAKSGHFGHSQVPENVHGDPGAIDIKKILGNSQASVRPGPAKTNGPVKPAPAEHTYKPGDKGEPVKAIQKALGFTPKNVDGDYGPRTKTAVAAFQKRNRLPVTGNVDPKTWAILRK